MGGYLGAVLHRGGARVHLVARGDHLEALRRGGLTVVDGGGEAVYPIPASGAVPALSRGDIAFVTVKAAALQGLVPVLREAGEAGASIVPLTNGVEAVRWLASGGVPLERTILGVAYVTAFRTAPGRVERQGAHGRLLVGCPWPQDPGPRPTALDALHPVPGILAGAAIEMEEPRDIELESWRKMLIVTALSGACVMEGGTIGQVLSRARGASLVRDLVAEAGSVGRAAGIGVSKAVEAAALERVSAFPRDFRPSLIHDLERGVPTEVEALNGAIARMGRRLGIPTPCQDRAAQMIREREGNADPSTRRG